MSEQPQNDALVDEDLDTAVGGQDEGNPFPGTDGFPLSGEENNVGATAC